MNFDCRWPPDRALAINLEAPAHLDHLLDDIRVAEELEIRHGDAMVDAVRLRSWELWCGVAPAQGPRPRRFGRRVSAPCSTRSPTHIPFR
jgi:hypothetical protein